MKADLKSDHAIRTVLRRCFYHDPEFHNRGWSWIPEVEDEPVDFAVAHGDHDVDPRPVFEKLRWGGEFVYVAEKPGACRAMAERFGPDAGFLHEIAPMRFQVGERRWFRTPRVWFFVARKVELIYPGDTAIHFTFDVTLIPHGESDTDYAVRKRIPSYEQVMERLRHRHPDVEDARLDPNARRLREQLFPILLTREVGFLRRLERRLEEPYRSRVPRVLAVEKDERGYAREVVLSWLRQGDNSLSQIEFAKQSAALLAAIHDQAEVVHLDLRLDNILVTRDGVCVVDYGSAAVIGEDLSQSETLKQLFDDWMRKSGVQSVLGKLIQRGKITSTPIISAHRKIDPMVDLFYLSLQFDYLHRHADYRGIVRMDPDSREAQLIRGLAREIMQPKDPDHPTIPSASVLVDRLEAVDQQLGFERQKREEQQRQQQAEQRWQEGPKRRRSRRREGRRG